jgi:hypothetical protein
MLMMDLCKYKDILGVPKQGFHKERLFGFARNDILSTIFGAFLISFFFYKKSFLYSFIIWMVILFILGIILHRIFCVNTTFNMILFGKV